MNNCKYLRSLRGVEKVKKGGLCVKMILGCMSTTQHSQETVHLMMIAADKAVFTKATAWYSVTVVSW